MAPNQSLPAFHVLSFTAFMLLLFCLVGVEAADKYKGTTKGFKKIFKGRCLDYLAKPEYRALGLIDNPPALGREVDFCETIWIVFAQAFAFKDACTVTPKDYELFFEKTGKNPIKDKILFWSKHEALSLAISNSGRRAVVLADTLPGYLVTGLEWCGEVKGKKTSEPPNPDGINYKECPTCPKIQHFEVFWGIASEKFAMRAQGIVHHLVNGAVGTVPPNSAYHEQTFFYKHELPNIDANKVTEFRLIVANEPQKKVHETCGTGTIKTLQAKLKEKFKKDAACIVNPSMVMDLMCADIPDAPDCLKANPYKKY